VAPTSLIRLELRYANWGEVIRKRVSISGSRCRFIVAICDSFAKSFTGRKPRTMARAPRDLAYWTVRPEYPSTIIRQPSALSPMLSRARAMRSSGENSSDFAGRS
jgi:hypothetical protein